MNVVALPPGRKWITVIDWATLETARLELAAWQRLKPEHHAGVRLRTVRSIMRRRLKYVMPTQAIKDGLRLLGEGTANPPAAPNPRLRSG